ncbi:MAG TPA: formate dehydrogenase subunit gamma [Methylibium sp.]|uniref:formate dehydrogenase subunit gamma n=1 Tax=Methylibium sp. TaxID=2067992 RepID=UPI002DB77BA3|nr:formate dehydrogenase subunit gamma [Methylibium sp.]HEU4459860.1 formate dehydrogenase subunit gamma [Methylibium sp.]
MSSKLLRMLAAALMLAAHAAVPAQTAAPQPQQASGPALPAPDESNAQRQKTQPYNNAPFWRGVRESGQQAGSSSLPGAEQGVLIQSFVQYPGSRFTTAGEAWREVRNRWILPYGGALLLITVLAIALFYKAKGAVDTHAPPSGRRIERFTYFERAAHWTNAITFVSLAISGVVIAFGKFFLLPVIGSTLFGGLTYALKTLHNFAGPLFAVSLVVVFFTFLRDNWPQKGDMHWLLKGGGMLGRAQHVPSHRFNAGEKFVFWAGVFVLGFFVVSSGLTLDKLIPGLAYTRGDMQIAHMIHAVSAVLMMCLFLGHIYLGTIGMKGAYRAMRTGYVDETWAREHHQYWADDIAAGKIPAVRSKPAEGLPPAATQARA